MAHFAHNPLHHRRSQSMFANPSQYPSLATQPLIPQPTGASSTIVPGPPTSTASLSYVPAPYSDEPDSKSMKRSKSKSRLSINLPSFFGSDHNRSASRREKSEKLYRTTSTHSAHSSIYAPPLIPSFHSSGSQSRKSSQDSEDSNVPIRPKTPSARAKTPHLRVVNTTYIPNAEPDSPSSPHGEEPIYHVKTSDDDAERWSFAGSDSLSNTDSSNSWIDGSAHSRQGSSDPTSILRYHLTGGAKGMPDKDIYSAGYRNAYQNFSAMESGPTKMPMQGITSPASSIDPSYAVAQFQAPQFYPSQIALDRHLASNPASPMSFPLVMDLRRSLTSIYNLSTQPGAAMTKFELHDLPATHPPIEKMTIVSPWFSQILYVDCHVGGKQFVTIGQVLSGLHQHLRQQIPPEQWASYGHEHQKQIEATYHANRSLMHPGRPDLSIGHPLLIDTVGESCYFMGLVRDEPIIKQKLGEAAVFDAVSVAYVAILGKSVVQWKLPSPATSPTVSVAVSQAQPPPPAAPAPTHVQAHPPPPPPPPAQSVAQSLGAKYAQALQQHYHQQTPQHTGYAPSSAPSAFGTQGPNNFGGWASPAESLPPSVPLMTGASNQSNQHRPGPRPVQHSAIPPGYAAQYGYPQQPHPAQYYGAPNPYVMTHPTYPYRA
ncbi:hypothetical protein FRC02_007703 [Tulasnella sp. 418]|nr:hypothetical protein FRC02_007703 [Tulasnella sp. 418]